MKKLKELISQLKLRKESFSKNPNRKFSNKFLLNTVTILKESNKVYINIVKDLDIGDESVKLLIDTYKKYYNLVEDFVGKRQLKILEETSNSEDNSEDETEQIMASFDLYQSMKIVPEFKGKNSELENFLNIVELVSDSLKDDTEREKLLKFIWTIKINTIVKLKINNNGIPKCLQELKNSLANGCPNEDTVQTLHSQLSRISQNGSNIDVYISKIESIILKLNRLNKETVGGDANTIEKMNDQLALNIFKEGLDEPRKSFIVAARPTSLTEATKLAKEMEAASKTSNIASSNVNFINKQRHFLGTNRNNKQTHYYSYNKKCIETKNNSNNSRYSNRNQQNRFYVPNKYTPKFNYQSQHSQKNNGAYSKGYYNNQKFPNYNNNYQNQRYQNTPGTYRTGKTYYINSNESKNGVTFPQGKDTTVQGLEQDFQNLNM